MSADSPDMFTLIVAQSSTPRPTSMGIVVSLHKPQKDYTTLLTLGPNEDIFLYSNLSIG